MPEITINNFTCRYDLFENKNAVETIVFVNGIASPLESWNQIRKNLNNAYSTLAYDLRGQWFSEVTPPPYSFRQMAEDLKALLVALNVDKAHIVGTSLGGEIALWFALEHPEICQSLVIIASVSEIKPLLLSQVERWQKAAQAAIDAYELSPELTPAEKGRLGQDFFDAFMPDVFSNRFIREHADIIEIQRKHYHNNTTHDYFRGFVYMCEMFKLMLKTELLTDKLHRINSPALIIAGEEDLAKLPAYSEIIAKHVPKAEYIIVPDAGHTVAIERPVLVSSIVRGFINNCNI